MPADDDHLKRIAGLEKRIAQLERELAEVQLSARRSAVQQALMDERLLTLERNRLFRLWDKAYRAAANLYGRIGSDKRYGGLSDLRTPGDYTRWVNREQHEFLAEDHRGAMDRWQIRPKISVVVQSGDYSLADQCYSNWELCRESDRPTGEYVLLLHAGDRLSPHALYFYAEALQNDAPDLVYADEDRIDGDGNRAQPLFKPKWSPELLASTAYLGRAVLYRTGLDHPTRACHIPRVLYHAAARPPIEMMTRSYVAPSGARLSLVICSRHPGRVRECLQLVRGTAVLPIEVLVVHHIESHDGEEMRQCVQRFGGTWIPYRGPFNFAAMNNMAAAKSTSPYLLFMNDDVMVPERGWDEVLATTLAQPEIGVAGVILEYPNGTIQHAGVVVGMGDAAGHCGRFQMTSDLWPWLRMSRDVSAVTGAMLGIRAELFQQMRGFDEAFPVNYNDVDLCLRVRQSGLRVVCLNAGKVIHREAQTRIGGTRHDERDGLYRRWAYVLARSDEFYSRHLAPTERIALATEVAGGRPLEALMC